MKKSILWLIAWLFVVPFAIVSCEETDGTVDPYFNWEERNQTYIDSIAVVAQANPTEWRIIHSYKFEPTDLGSLTGGLLNVNDYVYCKIVKSGNGATPLFTDTVAVNYSGRLIPLYNGKTVVFDKNFQGELSEETAMPTKFQVGGVITGWTTALQEMKEGDRWELYIPNELGYGSYEQDEIPAYSTLIFDLNLVEVKRLNK